MSDEPKRVVFDCNIFAQALMNPIGPAGACVDLAINGRLALFISNFVLEEIRDLPNKPTPRRVGVTAKKAESLISLIIDCAVLIAIPPPVFVHPVDPDDSHYVKGGVTLDGVVVSPGGEWKINCEEETVGDITKTIVPHGSAILLYCSPGF